ncbi:MAG TPA: ATP-binding protein, partial [Kouleothrix sp.]|nr:ATP-binding protein [Kouleothrix sp.]
ARLQAVSAALSETLTVEQVGDVIFEQGFAALDAMAGSVAVLDAQGTGFTSLRDIGYPPALAERYATFALDAALPIAEAVRARKPLLFETAAEWLARYPQLAQTGGAMVALPLLAGDRPLGGFAMIFADERNFSEDDRAFMQALAQQCAQALERAQLFVAEQQSRAQAEAAVRARDIFFEIAAHELRTPITALLGQAQLLQRRARRDTSISERDLRTAAVIGSQATRLNALVNALLDSSRLERGQLSLDRGPVDLSALVVRIVEESQPMLEHHSLVWELPDEPLVVDGDALRLEQVLQNLVGNAVKYSPAGGVVSIRARRDDQHMYVEVADQGMGIPASALPHLFQRFYRATNVDARQISGMGIGLYVVREIVHMHGGTVHASSTEGQGSTFVVTLPIPPGAERVSE